MRYLPNLPMLIEFSGLQGTTAELLKDIITIFYSPLATVYKAASIADSLSDGQNFINDLIRTVESVEEREHIQPGASIKRQMTG